MYTYCRPFGQDEEKHATWDNMFAKVSWKQAKGMWRVQRGQVFIVFSLLIKFLTIFTAFSQFNIGCISWLFMSMCIGIGLYFPLVARRWRWDMVEEQGDQRWATEDWWDPKIDCWYIYIYYIIKLYYIYNILYIINKYILYIFYIYIHIHIYIYTSADIAAMFALAMQLGWEWLNEMQEWVPSTLEATTGFCHAHHSWDSDFLMCAAMQVKIIIDKGPMEKKRKVSKQVDIYNI